MMMVGVAVLGGVSSLSVNHTGGDSCRWLVYMCVVFVEDPVT